MAELDNVKIGDKLFVFNNFMKDIEIVARNAMGYADALLTKIDEKGDNYGQE